MTSFRYRRKDYPRACDTCGHTWWFSQLKYVGANKWVCPDDSSMLTREEIARHAKTPLPHMLPVRPRRNPKVSTEVGVYRRPEADVLAQVVAQAERSLWATPMGATAFPARTQDIGCSMVYLGDLIADGKRPGGWLTQATAKLTSLANTVIARQYGTPWGLGPSVASNKAHYGGFSDSDGASAASAMATILCGLGLLRAYAVTSDARYLTAVNAAAAFLRSSQRCDQLTASFSANDPGGTSRFYLGGWPDSVSTAGVPSNAFNTQAAAGLWFLSELSDLVGDDATYGTAAGGDFAGATTGTLAQMRSEARIFYFEGRIANAGSSTIIAPASSATPRHRYLAYGCDGAGTGLFTLVTDLSTGQQNMVLGHDTALAVRGLYEHEGYSSTVAGLYSWLMSFESNPAFDTDKQTLRTLVSNILGLEPLAVAPDLTGTYDPTIALSRLLRVLDADGNATAVNGHPGYQLSTAGLLAPVAIAAGQSLRPLKDRLLQKTRRTETQESFYPLTMGAVGLDWQPDYTSSRVPICFVPNAALGAGVFRYAPQASPEAG